MTSQVIDFSGGVTANSTTYFSATLFGTGNFENQTVFQWGKYLDVFAKQGDGNWKISERTLIFMVHLLVAR